MKENGILKRNETEEQRGKLKHLLKPIKTTKNDSS
jgi:hypothetical protein